MPTLILLRHAKSDYPAGVPDHERPLSERGRRNASTIADHLRPFLEPGRSLGVAVSSARRAQETWAIAAPQLPPAKQLWTDRQLYLAEPSDLLEVTRAFETDIGILVGHNPGLSDLAASGRAADGDIAKAARSMRTSTFAVIDLGQAVWAQYQSFECASVVTCR